MNNQEYENKKRECWDDYTRKCAHEGKSAYGAFCFAFDRAYALGKQEKDAGETLAIAWAARDKNGDLFLFDHKPERVYNGAFSHWEGSLSETVLDNECLPSLSWESDPIEIELIIKRKNLKQE